MRESEYSTEQEKEGRIGLMYDVLRVAYDVMKRGQVIDQRPASVHTHVHVAWA